MSDTLVLSIIAQGYYIEFITLPPTPSFTQTPHSQLLANEVQTLLQKDAIKPVPLPSQGKSFYSHYFAVLKHSGGIHPIMDLRALNEYVLFKKFRMTFIQSILPLLDCNMWMVTIDLQDAYFHINIAPAHRRFLRFAIGDKCYEFKVFPFGIASAPEFSQRLWWLLCHTSNHQALLSFPI